MNRLNKIDSISFVYFKFLPSKGSHFFFRPHLLPKCTDNSRFHTACVLCRNSLVIQVTWRFVVNQPIDLGIRNQCKTVPLTTECNHLSTAHGKKYCRKTLRFRVSSLKYWARPFLLLFQLIGLWNFCSERDRRYSGLSVKSEINCYYHIVSEKLIFQQADSRNGTEHVFLGGVEFVSFK